jgi:hypothetical protein
MSTTFYVWYSNIPEGGGNVGHCAIKIGATYMSWWPAAGSKMEMLKGIFGTGSGFMTPGYKDDVSSEGKEPDYVGDHFGWNDAKAIQYWITQCMPEYARAVTEINRAGSPARYQFLTSNCSTMVINILRASGAFDGEVILNMWLSIKDTIALSPPDVMRISQYFAGHKSALIY